MPRTMSRASAGCASMDTVKRGCTFLSLSDKARYVAPHIMPPVLLPPPPTGPEPRPRSKLRVLQVDLLNDGDGDVGVVKRTRHRKEPSIPAISDDNWRWRCSPCSSAPFPPLPLTPQKPVPPHPLGSVSTPPTRLPDRSRRRCICRFGKWIADRHYSADTSRCLSTHHMPKTRDM